MPPRRLSLISVVPLIAAAGISPAWAEEPASPRLRDSPHFTIDPVVDGLLIVGGTSFDILQGLVLSTGEIQPQLPGDPLSIDKVAVTQHIDPHAGTYSDIGLWMATGFALLDPILSGVRDGRRALAVDATMCAESSAPPGGCTSDTNLQLSFFSGHASQTRAIAGTATYLAFARSGWRSPRLWITLAAGTLLTAFVSYERVRSGEHFPTDVIMGSMAGAGIGVLVPHFHRRPHYHGGELETPSVLIGYAPVPGGGRG